MAIIKVDYGEISGSKIENYEMVYNKTDATATSFTLLGMKGKRVLALAFSWYSSNSYASTRFDGATTTGATISKICNLLDVTARTQGTYYDLDITSDECVVTVPTACYLKVFEAKGKTATTAIRTSVGLFSVASGSNIEIDCGFKPSIISLYHYDDSNSFMTIQYDSTVTGDKEIGGYRKGSSETTIHYTIGSATNGVIQSITDTGFVFRGSSVFNTFSYTAIG